MEADKKRGCLVFLGGFGALMCAGILACAPVCWSGWVQHGMWTDTCPDGDPRLTVQANVYGVERGREGSVTVNVAGRYVTDDRGEWSQEAAVGRASAELTLVHPDGKEEPLECDMQGGGGYLSCSLSLDPELKDGDYSLKVEVQSPIGEETLSVPLPLYRPALVHLLSDRPLYEAGQTVRFRALALRRSDLAPLDDRPGTWLLTDPNGEVVLEERSEGGAWGVADSSFPLAPDAPSGTWRLAFVSGDDRGESTFEVRPFTLPRFTIEAQAEEPWSGVGDAPALSGRVAYSSGAPVAGADVELTLSTSGEWPLPAEWTQPLRAFTDREGRFRVVLAEVPEDLQGHPSVQARITATDPDGDQAQGSASIQLSRDPLVVDAVTELGDGLVPDFNNRIYLRVSTPDGRVLENAKVSVKNAWDPRDAGKTVDADADGVAALQLDPGQPVTVVIPAPPLRARAAAQGPWARVSNAEELSERRGPFIGESGQLEAALAQADRCAVLARQNPSVLMALQVRGGRITRAIGQGALAECIGEDLRGMPLGLGDATWTLQVQTTEQDLPWLSLSGRNALGGDAPAALELAAARASLCPFQEEANLEWSANPGDPHLDVHFLDPVSACTRKAFEGLENPFGSQAQLGVAHLTQQRPSTRVDRPQDTTTPGWELEVAVEGVGRTTWRAFPGTVPPLRLRPSKVVLEAGEPFEVEILRGPGWSGDPPSQLALTQGGVTLQNCSRIKDDPYADEAWRKSCPPPQDDNKVRFAPDASATGFATVIYGDAQAVVYIRPKSSLQLALRTEGPWRPGQSATIQVETGRPAVVSLTGVDKLLGELAPLPSPTGLNELTVVATTASPAFGVLDALALSSGRIQGPNAAMAVVQRVSSLRDPGLVPPPTQRAASTTLDTEEELRSTFWEILGDYGAAVRAWEAKAAEGEKLDNVRAAEIYASVLADRQSKDLPVEDPWGRTLELWRLPSTLLPLTDPRNLVRDATRLPEDIVEWTSWVLTEMER